MLDKAAMRSERTSVFRGVQMTAAIKTLAHETQHRFLNGTRAKTAAETEADEEPQSIQAESSAMLLLRISTQDPACTAASSSWHAHMRQRHHSRSRHATKHCCGRSDFVGIALRFRKGGFDLCWGFFSELFPGHMSPLAAWRLRMG